MVCKTIKNINFFFQNQVCSNLFIGSTDSLYPMKSFSILKSNNKLDEMKSLTQTMHLYNKCSSLQPVFCN